MAAYAGLFRSKGDAALTAGTAGAPTTLVENTAAPVANSKDRSAWSLGLKWMATSNIVVSANYLRADDKSTTNTDDRVIGLVVDYSLSKRTAAYVRYDNTDTDRQNGSAGKTTITAIGLRHSF